MLFCEHVVEPFYTFVRVVEQVPFCKDYNAVAIVRVGVRIRHDALPHLRKVPFQLECWQVCRNMNGDSTCPGFDLLSVHSMNDGQAMLDAVTECLKGTRSSGTARAHVNKMELYDLSVPVCEWHGMIDTMVKSKQSPVFNLPSTSPDVALSMLRLFPADPNAQAQSRRQVVGRVCAHADWSTGADAAYGRRGAACLISISDEKRPRDSAHDAYMSGTLELHLPRLVCACGKQLPQRGRHQRQLARWCPTCKENGRNKR